MFVDDYSRFTWVFPMKTKVGVPVHFHTFRLKVENLCNARIQCVQCDGGGEYTSSSFIAYLPDHGITQHLSCPHTPSQDGLAERKVKHLRQCFAMHPIRPDFGLTPSSPTYIVNRLLPFVFNHKTPFNL